MTVLPTITMTATTATRARDRLSSARSRPSVSIGLLVAALLARRRGASVERRAPGLAGLAGWRAAALLGDGPGQRRALGRAAARAARPPALQLPDAVVPRRHLLQQLPARATSAATSIRITDTAKAAGSKTLATTVVLIDRGLGLLGLALMAATGATLMQRMAVGPVGPGMLWAGFGARRDRSRRRRC